MILNRPNRRDVIKYAVGTGTALLAPNYILTDAFAATDQQTFTGFNGETIIWGGISYVPNDAKTALPNFFPLFDRNVQGSTVPIITDQLTTALESVDPTEWEARDFRLSPGRGGQGGTSRYGMIMAVAGELIMQESRTEINSIIILRLIAYNFIYQIDKQSGSKVLASYAVGGRRNVFRSGLDDTPNTDYFLSMFTGQDADESIADWYRNKFLEYNFNEIKIGTDYRVTAVRLGENAKKDLTILGLAENTFIEWVGTAATMSFGQELKVSMVPFGNKYVKGGQDYASGKVLGDLQVNFHGKEAFNLKLKEGDIQIRLMVHRWQINYVDHPRDKNKFAQKISVFTQINIFDKWKEKVVLNQLFISEEVQPVFKEVKYRRSDAATIYLLIEKLFDLAFAAITDQKIQKRLLEGHLTKIPTTDRNREIEPYMLYKVHPQTAKNFESECKALQELV